MKRLLLVIVCALSSFVVFAQNGNPQHRARLDHEQIASQKVAYITEKLSLTPTESEKFWPLYNQYWSMTIDLARAKRGVSRKIMDNTATQAEIDALIKLSREEIDLMERYAKLFATVLPVDKVAKFFVEQENFKSFLMRNAIKKQ